MFSKAPTSQIMLLGDHLSNAVQSSKQWNAERQQDEPNTLYITAIIPKDESADISITLCVGQETAFPLIDAFMLLPTWSSSPTHGRL